MWKCENGPSGDAINLSTNVLFVAGSPVRETPFALVEILAVTISLAMLTK